MAAVGATGGQILVKNIIPKHMDCITAKLVEMGVEVEEREDTLLVRRGPLPEGQCENHALSGLPHRYAAPDHHRPLPGGGHFPGDGGVWNNRYRYVDELKRMGASIQVDDKTAVVEGVDHLTGAPIRACDLRAGGIGDQRPGLPRASESGAYSISSGAMRISSPSSGRLALPSVPWRSPVSPRSWRLTLAEQGTGFSRFPQPRGYTIKTFP